MSGRHHIRRWYHVSNGRHVAISPSRRRIAGYVIGFALLTAAMTQVSFHGRVATPTDEAAAASPNPTGVAPTSADSTTNPNPNPLNLSLLASNINLDPNPQAQVIEPPAMTPIGMPLPQRQHYRTRTYPMAIPQVVEEPSLQLQQSPSSKFKHHHKNKSKTEDRDR